MPGRVLALRVSPWSVFPPPRQVVLVGQEPVLFSGSVRDNIAYGLKSCSDEKVMAAARAARAEEFINEMEHGLYTGTCSQRRTWSLFGRAGCGAVGGGVRGGSCPCNSLFAVSFPYLPSPLLAHHQEGVL